MKVTIRRNWHK